jgi:23S rRNA (guanine2445-N2)-methyltransferase / 23S rRNA (guanine2069-N7)-methyltransferase
MLGGARRRAIDCQRRFLGALYLDWARDNLRLNGLDGAQHQMLPKDVHGFLSSARRDSFDLAIVDPPWFSTRWGSRDFDVQRDHPELLRDVARLVAPGGQIIFSTNRWGFEPRLDGLPFSAVSEVSEQTVPREYRNRQVHRAYRLER